MARDLLLFALVLLAGTGCSKDKDRSFISKTGSGSATRSFFVPAEKDIVIDEETGLKIIKNVIIITFSPSTSRETAEKIIASVNGEIVGYDNSVNFYQVRLAGASPQKLDETRKKLLAQFKEVEMASKTTVSVHKNPYYVK